MELQEALYLFYYCLGGTWDAGDLLSSSWSQDKVRSSRLPRATVAIGSSYQLASSQGRAELASSVGFGALVVAARYWRFIVCLCSGTTM